jgi:hypothetical protein
MLSNRMAAERVRLAIYSGNTGITGGVLKTPYVTWRHYTPWGVGVPPPRRVLPTTPLLASAASASKPGWASNYLHGEIPNRYVSGEAILDGWKRPLIYVCQVVEGMHSAPFVHGSDGIAMDFSALDMGLHALGRRTLGSTDIITGESLTANPPYLPDIANLMRSDRRRYAPRSLELEFELWSAGPDGLADWMRDAVVNRDNVAPQAYDKGIP